jgi:hypothetical protein
LLFVDDALIAGPTLEAVDRVKMRLSEAFKIRDLKEARTFLSLSIHWDEEEGKLNVSQSRYIAKLLDRFKMEDATGCRLPMATGLNIREAGDPIKDKTPYGSLVGALMYLAVLIRPDIAYAVGQLSWYMSCPTEEHWTIAKNVLRYLKQTMDIGLVGVLSCAATLMRASRLAWILDILQLDLFWRSDFMGLQDSADSSYVHL